MSEANVKRAEIFRFWLIRVIWALCGVTLIGVLVGAGLFLRISKLSGWGNNGENKGQTRVYSKEQIEKFISSVLIVVQNKPLGENSAYADMLFIASFNAFEQSLSIVAFAPETIVDVDGYGQILLGEAYTHGGPNLLLETINNNFGLALNEYACTDTYSLAAMIDLLGGIRVELSQDEANYINKALNNNLSAGSATLSGTQSMVHALDNISGQVPMGSPKRSISLVRSAISNMRKTATKEAMIPLLSLVFSKINSNLNIATLRDWGYEILKAEEIEYRSIILPHEDIWKTVDAKSKGITTDIFRSGEMLRQTLYGIQGAEATLG